MSLAYAWIGALPWIATAGVVVEFAGADELRRPAFRRRAVGTGFILLAITALSTALDPVHDLRPLAVAAGPLAFVIAAELLRRALRRNGEEPSMAFTPRQGSARPGLTDFVYSMLLGLAMLLSVVPAIAVIIG